MTRITLIIDDEARQLKQLKCNLRAQIGQIYTPSKRITTSLSKQFGDTMRHPVVMGEILTINQKHECVSSFATRVLTSWQDSNGTDWKISDAKAQNIFLGILFTNIIPQVLKKVSSDFESDSVKKF